MRKGYITVFLALTLSVVLSLLVGLIYGVRENAIRYKIRDAADISIRSSFGEYDRFLWSRYNLIFVDAGYGYDTNSMILPEEHITACMNKNFYEERFLLLGGEDLLKLKCDNAKTQKVRFLSDENYIPLKGQAVRCMKYRTGLQHVEDLYSEMIKERELFTETGEGNRQLEEAIEEIESCDEPVLSDWVNAAKESVWKEKDISSLSSLRSVIRDISTVSNKVLNEELLIENREINRGNYYEIKELSPADKLLFREYLIGYTSDYVDKSKDTVISYETEYLIVGNVSEAKCLEKVVNRILLIREAANMKTLYSDTEKMEKIEAFAEGVATILMMPEIAEPIEILIVSMWCYAESISDVRSLLDKQRVPLIKNTYQWRTGMADILTGNFSKEGYTEGLSYEDYLRMFLYLTDDDRLAIRFSNLIEANERFCTENEDFRLDNCFDAWEVSMSVVSEYGYSYYVERKYDIGD